MCGIFFAISRDGPPSPSEDVLHVLSARGPHSLRTHATEVKTQDEETAGTSFVSSLFLTFTSSVLSLRGDRVCAQPLVDSSTGSVLCWNGEAWKIDDQPVTGVDSEMVFSILLESCAISVGIQNSSDNSIAVVNALTRVAGPFAFVFYDAPSSTVYYGRDRLGRRSLICESTASTANDLSYDTAIASFSLLKSKPAPEVTTDGIHSFCLRNPQVIPGSTPWPTSLPLISSSLPTNEQVVIPSPTSSAVDSLQKRLEDSLRLRVLDVPKHSILAPHSLPSKIAILFSGGLDCTLIARLCHDILPSNEPVDLLNVAFENPRTVRAAAESSRKNKVMIPSSPYETCPDRRTGRASYAELIRVCPNRMWRFVAIDVPYAEAQSHKPVIIRLMQPHNTEMDLSIAMALYFASRGRGSLTTNTSTTMQADNNDYTTTAPILLSGLGADELFGGYARHSAAFNRASYSGLIIELELDFARIGTRNLGRDDRVMSHWGREIRYPFLDEDFVAFALNLPVWEKVGFRPGKPIPKHFEENNRDENGKTTEVEREEDLDPAKMILRCLIWKLGMKRVANEKKRAIQFGARTAKMEGSKMRGTDLLST